MVSEGRGHILDLSNNEGHLFSPASLSAITTPNSSSAVESWYEWTSVIGNCGWVKDNGIWTKILKQVPTSSLPQTLKKKKEKETKEHINIRLQTKAYALCCSLLATQLILKGYNSSKDDVSWSKTFDHFYFVFFSSSDILFAQNTSVWTRQNCISNTLDYALAEPLFDNRNLRVQE